MANTKVTGELIANGAISQNHLNANHGITTSDIGESASLYYTDARVASYLSANNYINTETDPVFTASVASGITSTQITNWDTAYGWGDHSTQSYATQTYVNTAVAGLVDSAPTTLDTLNELAAALGDDPNFATTVTTSIGTKWTQDNAKISNWDTAYSWGNHASAGYITGYTETDTLASVTARGSNTTSAITTGLLIAQGPGGSYNENVRLPGSTSVISFNTSGATGPGSYNIVSQTNFQIRNASGAQVFLMNQPGDLTMTSSLRAPIFYDSNNTGYYVDPSSRSILADVEARNGINLRRDLGPGTGISFYTNSYYNWQIYMSPAGATSAGANANLTAPSGLGTVTNWALRSRMEGVATYGWLWETGGTGPGGATANVKMELGANTGTLRVTGDVIAYASDARLKTNIKKIDNSLNKIKKISGVTYDWIDNIEEEYGFYPNSMHEVGVLAQEVQEVLPEAVMTAPMNAPYTQKTGEDHNYLTVQYEKIVPLLIEAIKELSNKVEQLERNGTN